MLLLQIFPDSSYSDDWAVSTDHVPKLMYSDSFSARSNVAIATRQRRRSSTGDVELVQKDINNALKQQQLTVVEDTFTEDINKTLQQQQLMEDTMVTNKKLLPVKMESIGTPSSCDSTEESTLHPVTMVTQQHVTSQDMIINLHTAVTNNNQQSSDC